MKRLIVFAVVATAAFAQTAFAAAKLDEAKLVRLLECRPESADMKTPALDGLPTLGDKHPLVRSKAAPSGAQKLPKPITANGISGDVVFATGYNIFIVVPSPKPADDIMKTAKRLGISTADFNPEFPIYAFTKPQPSKVVDVNGRKLDEMRLAVYQGMSGPETDRYFLAGCEF